MDPGDLRAYLGRDWAAAGRRRGRALAAAQAPSRRGRGAAGGRDLREHVRALCPGWPTAKDREEDHETHAKVARALRRTPAVRGR